MSELQQAQELFKRGEFSKAADALLAASQERRKLAGAELLLGVALARSRRDDEAIPVFEELLRAQPDTYEALTWLAILTKKINGGDRAIEFAKRAIELRPNDARGYGVLGSVYQYYRQMEPAIEALKKAAKLDATAAEHQHNLGLAYQVIYEHAKARECFKKAIELAPGRPESYVALAEDYSQFGLGQAFGVLEKGISILPQSVALRSAMATVLSKLNQTSMAEREFKVAMSLSPNAVQPYAAWLVDQGRFAESEAIYEDMIRQRPRQGLAYYGLLQTRRISEGDPLLTDMASLRDDPSMGLHQQMYLRYALAKAQDQIRLYEQAIADLDEANRLAFEIHNAGLPQGAETTSADNRLVEQTFEKLDLNSGLGNATASPIFIVGMIRSGTTMLDQMLSNHPRVKAVGESGFWMRTSVAFARRKEFPRIEELQKPTEDYLRNVERLVGSVDKFTDKMPLNYAYCGIILAALPNARFLHIRRNPADTALSIYSTYFGPGTPFAYSKKNIVSNYREYLCTIAYWRDNLPQNRFMEIDYEDIVSKPEDIVPKILDFCELPWDGACLHPETNTSAILTPSRWQARQPVNTGSVAKWKRYEPWIPEFVELLGNP